VIKIKGVYSVSAEVAFSPDLFLGKKGEKKKIYTHAEIILYTPLLLIGSLGIAPSRNCTQTELHPLS
jgi:hypothetical protein